MPCYDQPMIIGKKISSLREEKEWSLADLAKKMGVHYTSIGRWEREETLPDAGDILKLAQIFAVSSDYLIFENSPRTGKIQINDLDLLKQFEDLQELPTEELIAIKKVIDAYILRAKLSDKFSKDNAATR